MKKRTSSLLIGAAIGVLVPTAVGCTMGGHRVEVPTIAPAHSVKVPCAPGPVFVDSGDETDCDLIGNVNTLNIYDIDPADADDFGCATWAPDVVAGTGYDCDF
jgi:hypothetical protein